jgi:hypothetical protein
MRGSALYRYSYFSRSHYSRSCNFDCFAHFPPHYFRHHHHQQQHPGRMSRLSLSCVRTFVIEEKSIGSRLELVSGYRKVEKVITYYGSLKIKTHVVTTISLLYIKEEPSMMRDRWGMKINSSALREKSRRSSIIAGRTSPQKDSMGSRKK